jgi:DNA-binding CsgD family transcriptional regulator
VINQLQWSQPMVSPAVPSLSGDQIARAEATVPCGMTLTAAVGGDGMYVVGLMYQSGSVAAIVKQELCAVPDIDVHLFSPPHGYREVGHIDVLITDCADADLLSGWEAAPMPTPPADVVLVVSHPNSDETAAAVDSRSTSQPSPLALSAIVRAALLNAHPCPPAAAERQLLSERERQVLVYIGEGFTQDQTARRLGISPHTVDTYVKRVRRKLGIGNKAELARAALMYM